MYYFFKSEKELVGKNLGEESSNASLYLIGGLVLRGVFCSLLGTKIKLYRNKKCGEQESISYYNKVGVR